MIDAFANFIFSAICLLCNLFSWLFFHIAALLLFLLFLIFKIPGATINAILELIRETMKTHSPKLCKFVAGLIEKAIQNALGKSKEGTRGWSISICPKISSMVDKVMPVINYVLDVCPKIYEGFLDMVLTIITQLRDNYKIAFLRFILISAPMAAKVMHAVQYDSHNGGLKHVQVPIPTPKSDEVLLKLEATCLNPIDWKIHKGFLCHFLPRKFPFIPVTGVAGVVVEAGSCVRKFKAGDKVVAVLSHLSEGEGHAEYAVVSEKLTVSMPRRVSAPEASGLPVAGLVALQALTQHAGLKLNETASNNKMTNVLVTAASSWVGHYAVQLAKLANAHVTAICDTRNVKLIKSLGADEVIDDKTPEGVTLKSPSCKKYDVVIHTATGIPFSAFEQNLSENGRVIDITPGTRALLSYVLNKVPWLKKVTLLKKQMVLDPMLLTPEAENLEFMVNLVRERKIKTVIDSKHPLSKAEDAWAKSIEDNGSVKIILEPWR